MSKIVHEIIPISKPKEGFVLFKEFSNGGRIEIHNDTEKGKSDFKDLLSISREFAKGAKVVYILPRLHFKDKRYQEIYGGLIGTRYERKCPDLYIDGLFYEYESFRSPFKKEKIGRMIGQGTKQSSRIIINNNKGCSERYIRRIIFERLYIGQIINEVWIYEKGKIRLLTINKGQ